MLSGTPLLRPGLDAYRLKLYLTNPKRSIIPSETVEPGGELVLEGDGAVEQGTA